MVFLVIEIVVVVVVQNALSWVGYQNSDVSLTPSMPLHAYGGWGVGGGGYLFQVALKTRSAFIRGRPPATLHAEYVHMEYHQQ